jgi:hypothetical protein
MMADGRLSDSDHPAVQSKAKQLAAGRDGTLQVLGAIFSFVRDEIPFGFPPKWDRIKASETLGFRLGYCNSKATLFLALCKALAIPARIHTGLIDLKIMRGLFPSFTFPFLPRTGSHSWMEVQVGGEWKPMDSYINDKPFYDRALRKLKASGWSTGFSISLAMGSSSCAFNFGEQGFVHMGAVVEDHGAWDDFSDYMADTRYAGLPSILLPMFPIMAIIGNRRVARIRTHALAD